MNLKELSQIDIKDLKNIDYRELLKNLKGRPDIIANTAIIFLAMVLSIVCFNSKKQELKKLTYNVSILETKWKIFEEFQKSQDILKRLKSAFPAETTEANLIELTAQQAEVNNITIESFSPAVKNDQKTYQTITLSISVSAVSYEDLWRFIAAIEKNKTIRIDTWRAAPGGARMIRSAAPRSETISANISLTVVNFKNA
ncbi:MAG: type 4a pilus biogenesis protein PilO [Candidatus Omnitrophota bacterium]